MASNTGGTNANDDHDAPGAADPEDEQFDPREYNTMLELERLETLEEDMQELGVTTLDEVKRRIAALHDTLDAE